MVYKAIEKLAWLTGSLSVIGVIIIVFLQAGEPTESTEPEHKTKRHIVRQDASSIAGKRVESPTIIKSESPKSEPPVKDPEPEITKPEVKALKEEEPKKKEPVTEPVKPKEKERNPITPPSRETVPAPNTNTGRLFAESELHQLVGKIQAANIRNNSATNCIQLRITADNNNMQAVSQVERFLAAKNYIIIGREKEDFLRGSGLKLNARGKCLTVTVGRK